MDQRIDYTQAAPEVFQAMLQLERQVRASGLEPALLELVRLRASQLNGCAYCVDMHHREARTAGEGEERLSMVVVWQESPLFSPRERAALAWTESLTLLPRRGAPEALYQQVLAEFGEEGLASLTLAIVAINGWNRFGVAFALEPGR